MVSGRFGAKATYLFLGTGISQGLLIAASPVLTRLYEPESFGVLAAFTAALALALPMVNLRFDLAVASATDPTAEKDFYHLSCLAAVAVATLYALGLSVSVVHESMALDPTIAALIVVCVLATGLNSPSAYSNIKNGKPRTVALGRVLQSAAALAMQISLGLLPTSSGLSLVLGTSFGMSLTAGVNLRFAMTRYASGITYSRLIDRWRQNYRYATLTTPAALASAAATHAPALMLTASGKIAEAGYLLLAGRVLTAPSSTIGVALAQAFITSVPGDIERRSEAGPLVYLITENLMRISLPIFAYIGFHGGAIFAAVFGDPWSVAGDYASYLCIWMAFNFTSSPVSTLPVVWGLHRQSLFVVVVTSAVRAAAFAAGLHLCGPAAAVLWYSLVSAASSIIFMGWIVGNVGTEGAQTAIVRVLPIALICLTGNGLLRFIDNEPERLVGGALLAFSITLFAGFSAWRGYRSGR